MATAMNPADFDRFQNEYDALTNDGGFISLEKWSTISIAGNDRLRFLHNMCTNDIQRLSPGEGCEAFCTDVKGKIVAHVFVAALAEQLVLLTTPNQAESIIRHLDRYVIREDVRLDDETDQFSWLLVSGATSSALFEEVSAGDSKQLKSAWQHARFTYQSQEYLLLRFDQIWPASYLLRCHRSGAAVLHQALENAGVLSCSPTAWTALRVESGFPLFGVDFDQSHLPQEVNRNEQAINFNKGCYLGQETIARIDALGHVNKKLVCLRFESESVPEAGLELRSQDEVVGKTTTACWSPQLKAPAALAMIRRGSNDTGSELDSAIGKATVVDFPMRPTP